MPAAYEHLGIRFMYPENWTIVEDLDDGDDPGRERNSVTAYSPSGAFWSIVVLPASVDPDPLVEEAVAALRKEYDHGDCEPAGEAVGRHRLSGYDLNFFYLDLTNTATVRGLRTPGGTFILHSQAEDREYQQLEAVFRAITTSLLT